MEDANLSSLVPGLNLIHKTTLLTRIYNSSQYNMDECTCRKERIHCKRGLLTQSLSKSPEPQELQFLLKLSSIDEVPRFLWNEEGLLSSLLNPILLYRLWKWTSTLTGKWFLETHLLSILLLRLLLVPHSQAGGWRLRLQLASRGSSVFSQQLKNGLYT